jgi:hypothetical protein
MILQISVSCCCAYSLISVFEAAERKGVLGIRDGTVVVVTQWLHSVYPLCQVEHQPEGIPVQGRSTIHVLRTCPRPPLPLDIPEYRRIENLLFTVITRTIVQCPSNSSALPSLFGD